MKCMIIGSNVCKSHEYEKVCAAIGKAIVFCMHDLIVCSPFKDSADYWVANSFLNEKNSKNKCYFYYPNMKNVVTEIGLIRNEFKQLRCIYNKIENLDDPLFSWLFCQLKALEEADYIFALGGKENKSAKLLLSLAEAKNKLIIPFSKFGGASKEYYHTTEYKYQRLDKGYILSQNNIECMPQHICEIIDDLLNFRNSDHVKKIFISYPREKN